MHFVLLWPSWLGRQTHKLLLLRYLEVAGSDPVNSIPISGWDISLEINIIMSSFIILKNSLGMVFQLSSDLIKGIVAVNELAYVVLCLRSVNRAWDITGII